MIRRTVIAISMLLGASVCLFASGAAQAAQIPESGDPIKMAVHEFTANHVDIYLSGQILERMGYKVEYVTAGGLASPPAIADGSLTVSMEWYDNNMGDWLPKLMAEGKVENLGPSGIIATEGFLYPKHMEAKCPGLPAWQSFLDCAEVLSTPETFPNGRFLEYPPIWSDRATKLFAGEKLPFTSMPAGSEGALVSELKASVQKQSPLVMMFYGPHAALVNAEVGWVQIPEDLAKKYNLVTPKVFNIIWPGAKDKWPAAYKFLKEFRVTNEIQQQLMDQIDNQGQDAREATKKWLDANESYWKPMVEAAMK